MRTPDLLADEFHVRLWQTRDAGALSRACQDPELARWLSGWPQPYRLADAVDFIEHRAIPWAEAGTAFQLGVFAGDEVCGGISLHAIDPVAHTAELGYWTAAPARGRRVAERAGRALAAWAFAEGFTRIDWRAAVGNHASRLTALRIGFRIIGVRPAPAKWLGSLTPADLTAAGRDVSDSVRRTARTFHGEPPILDAGPVTLRRPAERDVPGLVTALTDPESVAWFGVRLPYTAADAEQHVLEEVPGFWARGTEAVFAIVDELDAYQGSIDVRVTDGDPAVGELGYVITPGARGRGYAVAAVRALSRWAFEALGLRRLEVRIAAGNESSLRVAIKAGFTVEGLLRQALVINGKRHDARVAALLREEVV